MILSRFFGFIRHLFKGKSMSASSARTVTYGATAGMLNQRLWRIWFYDQEDKLPIPVYVHNDGDIAKVNVRMLVEAMAKHLRGEGPDETDGILATTMGEPPPFSASEVKMCREYSERAITDCLAAIDAGTANGAVHELPDFIVITTYLGKPKGK